MTVDPRIGGLCRLCGTIVKDPDNAVSPTEHKICPGPVRYHDHLTTRLRLARQGPRKPPDPITEFKRPEGPEVVEAPMVTDASGNLKTPWVVGGRPIEDVPLPGDEPPLDRPW